MHKRILIYAPDGQNANLAAQVFDVSDIKHHICANGDELMLELARGAGALLTVEEALSAAILHSLMQYIDAQATWSDLPILLLTKRGADSASVRHAIDRLGNVTLLERPIRISALLSAGRSALRARMRQYQVRDADYRKDEFLASLGHELRNPLAPIRTSVGLLKHLYPDLAPVAKTYAVVERQIVHLTRLVDDLLDVARITSGKVVLQPASIMLSDVVTHVMEICGGLAESRRHQIEINYPSEPVLLKADRARLVQTLANVLANAVKFTLTPNRIMFNARVDDGNVIFSIRDFGMGLEAASLSRIFDIFVQAQTSAGQAPSGLGIGLSLARQFTEMHGGTIKVKSEGLGHGSEFILTLPIVVQADLAGVENNVSLAQTDVQKCADSRILIVDDNQDACDTLCALFEADGYTVAVAYDGYQAVELAKEVHPGIIVLDIGLPGIDGYEAARRIRMLPGGEKIQMIALTGWGQVNDKRLAMEAGFDCHLVKPVDFTMLRSCIAEGHTA
ncbi:response regulator [Herminiimonas aquatilis]|uniref:histidine kinase n=1 Tax=Herminiimonas aquatilis TaxID=345342 RepID=A0ABW2J4G6_9BURK